jgi:hypothetical protein
MYLGAAALLWLVRAWKIGDLEHKAAMAQVNKARLDPGTEGLTEEQDQDAMTPARIVKTTFMKRLFMWQRV